MASQIRESRVREIVQQELELHALLDEGLWDDVAGGVKKLRGLVTKRFGSNAAAWGKAISALSGRLKQRPKEIDQIMSIVQAAMQKSGERIQLDSVLRAAKEIGSVGSQGAMEMAQQDLKGPVHDRAEQAQSSVKAEATYLGEVYQVILDEENVVSGGDRIPLNEAGVVGVIGIAMATLGGSLMLFRGLKKLALSLGAERLAAFFDKIVHVLHKIEHKGIDKVIPDRVAYFVYSTLHKRNIKIAGSDLLNLDDFRSDANHKHAMATTKGFIYKVILIYFMWSGIAGAVKAGASLLGFVEGAASTVKGVEVAAGAGELMAIARSARV